ncbi:AraC family ligand binding domain-containing protein [Alcanivorax sp.]
MPEGLPHRYQADDSDPWSIYWVHLGGMRSQGILTKLPGRAWSVSG